MLREGYGGARCFLPGQHPTLPNVKVDRCVAIEGPTWLQVRGIIGGSESMLLASFAAANTLFYELLP
jgi:hypothetical protein